MLQPVLRAHRAAGVVLILLVALSAGGATQSPSPASSPSTSPVPSACPTASSEPCAVVAPSFAWEQAKLPDAVSSSLTYPGSIAIHADGVVVLLPRAAIPTDPAISAWRFTDGLAWTSIEPATGEQKQRVWAWIGVATIGERFLAIGADGSTFASDTGLEWKITKQGIKGSRPERGDPL